jgi:hypothetical protein
MHFPRYAFLLLAACLSAAAAEPPARPPANPPTDAALAAELVQMEEADQRVRDLALAAPSDRVLMEQMKQVDARNEARLKEIVAAIGWPTVKRVGKQGAHAAWLLTQHGSAALLKASLPDMKAAAEAGDLDWSSVALSIDRSLMDEGKKQIYGSQFQQDASGAMQMYPVEDEAHLDERRAQVGLGPIAEYRALILKMYAAMKHQP